MKYIHEQYKCPECGSSDSVIFDEKEGMYVCTRCGTVIKEHVPSMELEIRPFDVKIPRTSGSYTNKVHDRGIGSTEFDGYRNSKWREMIKLQKSVRVSKKERIVEKALRHLNQYARTLEVPSYVSETAAKILRQAVEGKNYKSKTLKNLAIASIYLAYKLHGLHKPAKLYVKEAGISLKELWHAEKKIHGSVKKLNMMMKRENPEVYIYYIVNQLGLSPKVEKLALELLFKAKQLGLHIGRPGIGLATASVYLASILLNEKKTQLQIASVVNVSDVTIRNRYSDLIESLDITVYL